MIKHKKNNCANDQKMGNEFTSAGSSLDEWESTPSWWQYKFAKKIEKDVEKFAQMIKMWKQNKTNICANDQKTWNGFTFAGSSLDECESTSSWWQYKFAKKIEKYCEKFAQMIKIWKQNETTHRSRRRRWHPTIMARHWLPTILALTSDGVDGGIHDLLMSENNQKIGEMYLSKWWNKQWRVENIWKN